MTFLWASSFPRKALLDRMGFKSLRGLGGGGLALGFEKGPDRPTPSCPGPRDRSPESEPAPGKIGWRTKNRETSNDRRAFFTFSCEELSSHFSLPRAGPCIICHAVRIKYFGHEGFSFNKKTTSCPLTLERSKNKACETKLWTREPGNWDNGGLLDMLLPIPQRRCSFVRSGKKKSKKYSDYLVLNAATFFLVKHQSSHCPWVRPNGNLRG